MFPIRHCHGTRTHSNGWPVESPSQQQLKDTVLRMREQGLKPRRDFIVTFFATAFLKNVSPDRAHLIFRSAVRLTLRQVVTKVRSNTVPADNLTMILPTFPLLTNLELRWKLRGACTGRLAPNPSEQQGTVTCTTDKPPRYFGAVRECRPPSRFWLPV